MKLILNSILFCAVISVALSFPHPENDFDEAAEELDQHLSELRFRRDLSLQFDDEEDAEEDNIEGVDFFDRERREADPGDDSKEGKKNGKGKGKGKGKHSTTSEPTARKRREANPQDEDGEKGEKGKKEKGNKGEGKKHGKDGKEKGKKGGKKGGKGGKDGGSKEE